MSCKMLRAAFTVIFSVLVARNRCINNLATEWYAGLWGVFLVDAPLQVSVHDSNLRPHWSSGYRYVLCKVSDGKTMLINYIV